MKRHSRGQPGRVFEAVEHIDGFDQYLLRALIYRAVSDRLFSEDEPMRLGDADPYLPVVALACLAGAP